MKKLYFFINCFLVMLPFIGWSQIVSEGFNNSMALFTGVPAPVAGDYRSGNSAAGDRPASTPFTIEGSASFGCNAPGGKTVVLTSADIYTAGYSSPTMTFRLASFSFNTTNGADLDDFVKVDVSDDGGATYLSPLIITGAGANDAYWGFSTGTGIASRAYSASVTPVTFTPAGSGSRTIDGYSTVTITGLPSVTNLKIRITMLNTHPQELWLIDDFKITGSVAVGGSTIVAGTVPEPATISSLINTQAASSLNFDFIINDDGTTPATDGLPFLTTQFTITQAAGNDIANWTQAIAGAVLTDGVNTIAGTVNAANITFSGIPTGVGQLGYIADDNSKEYTLKIWLRATLLGTLPTTIDGLNFAFNIQNTGVLIGASSSALATGQTISTDPLKNMVTVVATKLAFVQQPSTTTVSANMSPSPTVQATDINGNRDLDVSTGNISITSTGSMIPTPQVETVTAGIATFPTITHTVVGTGFVLTATYPGLTNAVSNPFNITAYVFAAGDYRPAIAGTTFTTNGQWEQYNGVAWVGGQIAPENIAEASRPTNIFIDKANIDASANATNMYKNILVFPGGSLLINTNAAPTKNFINAGNRLEVYNGGSVTMSGQIFFDATANFIVRDGGTFTINNINIGNSHNFWRGVENFEQGSIFNITNHAATGAGSPALINVYSQITDNVTGAKFGNLNINFSPANNWTIVDGDLDVTLCDNLTVNNNSATTQIVMFSNANTPSAILRGNLTHTGGIFSLAGNFTAGTTTSQTLNINGNLSSTAGTLKTYFNNGLPATVHPGNVNINLKGNLSVSSSSFTSDATVAADIAAVKLNFNNNVLQTLSVVPNCTKINYVVKANASVQLQNQDLKFAGNSSFLVESNAMFDFGFNGLTALRVMEVGGSSNSFTSQQASYLKITSKLGLSRNPALPGNVEGIPFSNRAIDAEATFHYIGKEDQVTGNAITTVSNGKVLICDLIDNTKKLTFTNATRFSGGTNVSPTGGKLDIRVGQVIEDEINYVMSSGGTLYMSPGTLYKITKGSATDVGLGSSYNDPIPRMSGGSFPYVLSGGTIELGATVAGNLFQVIRADNASYNYYNLKFSGTNTLGTDYRAFTTTTNIDNSLIITGTAVVDCKNSAGIALPVRGDGGIVMDGGRFRTFDKSNPQPELLGVTTPYNLTGGVIEFYASGGVSNETIRGKDGNGNPIEYNQIEITGDKVGNSNSNITLRSDGSFTVKSTGAFEINDESIIGPTGNQTVTVENGGVFKAGNNKGFHGFVQTLTDNSSVHQNIESIVLNAGSTVNYTRDDDQPVTNDVITATSLPLSYSNIIISGNSGNKIAPATTLTVTGDFTKTGASTFDANTNSSTVLLSNATAVQNINNTGSTALNFFNVTNDCTFNTGLSVNNSIGVGNALTLNANSKLNLNAAYLTMLSVATRTAYVAQVPATASITYTGVGRFVVERYYIGNRAWRLITAPVLVDNTKSIFNSWQLGGVPAFTGPVGNGTYVSGPSENAINGFDVTPLHNYSLRTYDAATDTYIGVPGTKATYISGTTGGVSPTPANLQSFFMFVRGDRSSNNPLAFNAYANTVVETTLRDTGKIQLQNYSFPCSSIADQFTLIGNPYASPVDFNAMTKNNVTNQFWSWDPTLSTVGAYVIVDAATNTTVPLGANQDKNIQSSQAVLVKTIADGSASVEFDEADKTTVDKVNLFRPVNQNNPQIAINLYLLNTDGTKRIADGVLAQYNKDFSNAYDYMDGVRFNNINETFGIIEKGTTYMLHRRQPLTENDTIFFSLRKARQVKYRFNFMLENFAGENLTGQLEDTYLKTSEPIQMDGSSWIDFEVNKDPASAASDRFRILFKKTVRGCGIEASIAAGNANVNWWYSDEIDMHHYEVERSTDGINFEKIAEASALNNGSNASYLHLDEKPAPGIYYYRIKGFNNYGSYGYSETVKVKIVRNTDHFFIFPNPVTDGNINLQMNNTEKGTYKVTLINGAGQLIMQKQIVHPGGSVTHTLKSDQYLASGTYQLEVAAPGKKSTVIGMVVKGK